MQRRRRPPPEPPDGGARVKGPYHGVKGETTNVKEPIQINFVDNDDEKTVVV